jgi:hypothetical protein
MDKLAKASSKSNALIQGIKDPVKCTDDMESREKDD